MMYCLRLAAKHYYDTFYNPIIIYFRTGSGLVSSFAFLLSLMFFVLAILDYSDDLNLSANENITLGMSAFGVWFIFSLFAIRESGKKSIRYVEKTAGVSCDDVEDARNTYMVNVLSKQNLDPMRLVGDRLLIRELLKSRGESPFFIDLKFSEVLFQSESKNRLNALFIFLCAIILTLGVKNGADLSTVYEVIFEDFRIFLAIVLMIFLSLVGVLICAYMLSVMIKGVSAWIFSNLAEREFAGPEIMDLFIRDIHLYCGDCVVQNKKRT